MSRTKTRLYKELAALVDAVQNCRKSNNTEWEAEHRDSIETLVKNYLPSGGGIDTGTKLDLEASTPNKLVFHFSYHHMNDAGMYDGWTDHVLTVTPDLRYGFDTRISGKDRNDIKEYLYEIYHNDLTQKVWQDEDGNWHSAKWETAPPE